MKGIDISEHNGAIDFHAVTDTIIEADSYSMQNKSPPNFALRKFRFANLRGKNFHLQNSERLSR